MAWSNRFFICLVHGRYFSEITVGMESSQSTGALVSIGILDEEYDTILAKPCIPRRFRDEILGPPRPFRT